MHHPILFAFLAAFVVTRLVSRMVFRRRFGWAHGGGCGRAMHVRGPRGFRRWREFEAPPGAERRTAPVDLTASLELNGRQKALYDEVITRAKPSLSAAELADVLHAVAQEPFDRGAVEQRVSDRELVDDIEQLHDSLTPEQREKLRALT